VGEDLAAALRDAGADDVRAHATMGDLTTLRVGGPVSALVVAESDADLQAVSRVVRDRNVAVFVVGRGSNLLVPDAGWPGVAVTLGRGYRGIDVNGTTVRAGAAEPLPSLAVHVADAGLGGFAWAAAVPGSLGGAVRMNAGAHGGEMSECIVEVEVFRLHAGMRETWAAGALGMRYRRTELPGDAVVVAATLSLAPASPEELRSQIAQIRQWRREHQPINEPNCGSVFTNPPGDSAGRLIDEAGGKGLVRGGARVSERHANFIVTSPGATAADVHALIVALQDLVEEHAGVRLHPEVVMIGDHPNPVS
jgi:UDP-N-acetylmuramate dehydrogenase